MVILALDTTTRQASCAVWHDHRVLARVSEGGQAHAVHLPRDLMAILEEARLTLDRVDAFAVAIGPGSFTGLRVGIATMQGLAFAERKPLIGVSALDALAAIAAPEAAGRPVAVWIDAWRGEVYASVDGEAIVATPGTLLGGMTPGTLFIGDGAVTHRDAILQATAGLGRLASPPDPPIAGTIASLAVARVERGEHPAPDAIRPLYVRRPDAELARRPGMAR